MARHVPDAPRMPRIGPGSARPMSGAATFPLDEPPVTARPAPDSREPYDILTHEYPPTHDLAVATMRKLAERTGWLVVDPADDDAIDRAVDAWFDVAYDSEYRSRFRAALSALAAPGGEPT